MLLRRQNVEVNIPETDDLALSKYLAKGFKPVQQKKPVVKAVEETPLESFMNLPETPAVETEKPKRRGGRPRKK